MNKTKLKVIRINEDVIATSTLTKIGEYSWCCYKFSDNHLDVGDSYEYYFVGEQEETLYLNSGEDVTYNNYFSNSGMTLQAGVWYAVYYDSVSGKSCFYPCDGSDHSDHSHS